MFGQAPDNQATNREATMRLTALEDEITLWWHWFCVRDCL